MAEKPSKDKGADKSSDSGVLAALPATRPTRLGRHAKGESPATPRKAGPAPAKTTAKTPAKPKAASSAKASTKASATASKAEAAATKARAKTSAKATPKASAKASPKSKATATAAAARKAPAKKAAPREAGPSAGKDTSTVTPLAAPEKPRPVGVSVASPSLREPAEKAAVQRRADAADDKSQSGTDIVKTVVQAAGELAQIGATVGGQVIKRVVDRLPKKP